MRVHKEKIRTEIVSFTRPLRCRIVKSSIICGIHRCIPRSIRSAICDSNHIRRRPHLSRLDVWRSGRHVPAKPQMRICELSYSPIIVTVGKVGISTRSNIPREFLVAVDIGLVPPEFRFFRRAIEGLGARSHRIEQATRPNNRSLIRRSRSTNPKVAGIGVFVVAGVHSKTDAHLFQIIQAGGLFGLGLRLGESGQQHAGQDGDDGNNHQQFNQSERGEPPPSFPR